MKPYCKYNAIVLVKLNLGGVFMAKKVSMLFPVAERITEFNSGDFRKNPSILHLSEDLISEEAWREFAENALVIIDGWHILQYAEEYPIVEYKCDENASCYLGPDYRLNSFIHSITVSTALHGKKYGVGTGRISSEITDYDTVVYYTDHAGIRHSIIQNDICQFLLEKPKLVVSPEGMLIFFTEKKILATVDCNHYHWIDGHVIDVEGKTIKNIKVYRDCCKVILLDKYKCEHIIPLRFNFDITALQMICPNISEL